MKRIRKIITGLTGIMAVVGCEGIDCTLDNVVALNVGLYDSSTGAAIALSDTLTVTAAGTDSVIYNRGVNTSKLQLPMSYWGDADTLCLRVYGKDYAFEDVITIRKTNTVHYESPDCATTMFHTIEGVTWVSALKTIDSVVVCKPSVNYEKKENIRIYYHTADSDQ